VRLELGVSKEAIKGRKFVAVCKSLFPGGKRWAGMSFVLGSVADNNGAWGSIVIMAPAMPLPRRPPLPPPTASSPASPSKLQTTRFLVLPSDLIFRPFHHSTQYSGDKKNKAMPKYGELPIDNLHSSLPTRPLLTGALLP
jgi:hypothetical protein